MTLILLIKTAQNKKQQLLVLRMYFKLAIKNMQRRRRELHARAWFHDGWMNVRQAFQPSQVTSFINYVMIATKREEEGLCLLTFLSYEYLVAAFKQEKVISLNWVILHCRFLNYAATVDVDVVVVALSTTWNESEMKGLRKWWCFSHSDAFFQVAMLFH